MSDASTTHPALPSDAGARFASSARSVRTTAEPVESWLTDVARRSRMAVSIAPLTGLPNWYADPDTGDIRHRSGKFFTIHGLRVDLPGAPVPCWEQPIIDQPEIGTLGILAKEFDGVPHVLMQAKNEPGNVNGLQLSPTVQATRSNYTRVHGGRAVPYLEYFQDSPVHRLVTDVRQSEQGTWFFRKRNRNMVAETSDDVEVLDGFRWLSLAQVHRLLSVSDMVNMDTRTVLSCLPFTEVDPAGPGVDEFHTALARSTDARHGSRHHMDDILKWITDVRTAMDIHTDRVPLDLLTHWYNDGDRVRHVRDWFFDVIGVRVETVGREVSQWSQPILRPRAMGVVAFLVHRIDGVLHVLVHARAEPGYVDVAELAPTLQCTPATLAHLPESARPPLLDHVLNAPGDRIRFDAVQSEEGGRFYHARNRYLIVETDLGTAVEDQYPNYRWMTPHQLADLLRHSHYVNVQARSLLACLRSLHTPPPGR
ncbi:NDP-hexose 2,3-dehydratase [Actinosynnema sp. ALI-1.44]|uniref:NDP-hexose 2,3-dehydratase family protein n=1 Tax=Actinosynnema sp. ALI-1.44 TaxID=1933779 RepID=UPI00097BB091|nr:NDP-hexose 2,3-dehydratase family protein [Actinosynnema sp. ALI-1.44]ONI76344.1 NDP-hexose 2,3-dehydratase [Actinosynnema sp. ALI-1.44]